MVTAFASLFRMAVAQMVLRAVTDISALVALTTNMAHTIRTNALSLLVLLLATRVAKAEAKVAKANELYPLLLNRRIECCLVGLSLWRRPLSWYRESQTLV
jgi:hypothetical protein